MATTHGYNHTFTSCSQCQELQSRHNLLILLIRCPDCSTGGARTRANISQCRERRVLVSGCPLQASPGILKTPEEPTSTPTSPGAKHSKALLERDTFPFIYHIPCSRGSHLWAGLKKAVENCMTLLPALFNRKGVKLGTRASQPLHLTSFPNT